MSDSNRTSLLFVPESTYGVTPATPTMAFMRLTGETLKQDTSTVTSQEIRSDRQIADLLRTDLSASGDLNFELSTPPVADAEATLNQFDRLTRAVLQSAGWSNTGAVTDVTASMTVTASDQSLNSSAAFGSLNEGQWLRILDRAEPENNGLFKIVTKVSSSKLILAGAVPLVDGSSASTTARMLSQIVNGTTQTSFTIERRYEDVANEFAAFPGSVFGGMSLSVQRGSIVTGGFNVLGRREQSRTSTLANAVVNATTTPVMNAIDDLDWCGVHLPASGGGFEQEIIGCSFAIQNNMRPQTVAGALGAVRMGSGSVNVTGQLTAYFQNKTLFDRYLNFTQTSLALILRNPTLNTGWIFEFPCIKFSAGSRPTAGLNQDVTADLQWTAYRHPTELVTCRVARIQ